MNEDAQTTGSAQSITVHLINNPGMIASTGLNAAIRASQGEIVIRMDAHTEYAPDYIQKCVETLEKTQADNVGGPARTKAASFMQKAIAAAYHCGWVIGGAPFHNVGYEGLVGTVPYGCWRRSAFDRFGFFDEQLVRNQDDEHNFRIHLGGGTIWQSPDIRSWYAPRSSLAALSKQYFQYGYWKVRVMAKHGRPAKIRHVVPPMFVVSILMLALLAPWYHWACMLLIGEGMCYTGYVIFSTLVACVQQRSIRFLPVLPIVVVAFQVSYGFGFLMGLADLHFTAGRLGKMFSSLSR